MLVDLFEMRTMTASPPTPRRDLPIGLPLLLTGFCLAAIVLAHPDGNHADLPGYWSLHVNALLETRHQLSHALGLPLFLMPLAILSLALDCLMPTLRIDRLRRVVAWIGLLATATLTADVLINPGANLPVWGAGGIWGAFLSRWFADHFTPMGTGMIFFALGLTSILFALERYLCWAGVCLRHLPRPRFKFPKLRMPKSRRSPVETNNLVSPPIPLPSRPQLDQPPTLEEAGIVPKLKAPTPSKVDGPIPITRMEPVKTPKIPKPVQAVAKIDYDLPSLDLLDEPSPFPAERHDEKLRQTAILLEQTLKDFGVNVKVVGIHTGPVVTQYEIALETGLRLAKVANLADDLALNLAVQSIRIVPINGKNTLGVEVPNELRVVVRLKELVLAGQAKAAKARLPLFLGKDSEGHPLIHDLAEMPHLLIAGRTGTGKSVCLNTIIVSLLLTRTPLDCRLIMIDPKKVELADYATLPHLMMPVVTENDKAEAVLGWAVEKMEERYELLRKAKVRNIAGYNDLTVEDRYARIKPNGDEEKALIPEKLPSIVIVVDEVGDLMMEMKKEVEGHIIRLAQKSRAAGIHLILTTQRPTVDVITGLIKSNLPARISFQVTNRTDSRVILDEMGAEKLLGKGDMLFLQPNTSRILRAQGTFASDQEIKNIVAALEREEMNFENELVNLPTREEKEQKEKTEEEAFTMPTKERDPMYRTAIEIVLREQRGSVSLLQRSLGIGYGRSARLIDFMAEDGIVGDYNGAQAREVKFTLEQWHSMQGAKDELSESA